MDDGDDLPELRRLAINLARARFAAGLSQDALASRCRLSQAQVSLFESGRRRPSLDQFVRMARGLDVPLQCLLGGEGRPGVDLKDLAVELRGLGLVDLWVADAVLPGAARQAEEVIALSIVGQVPDPRVVEALPALLSWNPIHPAILHAQGIATKSTRRLAWLADVALMIDRREGFPGGCSRATLERFLKSVRLPTADRAWDDLGHPSEGTPPYPAWRRWKIRSATTPGDFERRARHLASLRGARVNGPALAGEGGLHGG